MNGPEMLARAIDATEGLLLRFVADIDDDERATQLPGLPNHVIWTLGHCAMTMNRLASMLDGEPLPESDFVAGDGTAGDAERFDTESVRFDSTPVPDADCYPGMERGRAVYAAACRRLAGVVRSMGEDELDGTLDWHGTPVPIADLVLRVGFHNGAHAGQILDLRRGLGKPRVIG
ncbi:MAG: DinB family protein [Planctomycetota bacterium]|nr:DinB family protein [Planctomycetota bacterium]